MEIKTTTLVIFLILVTFQQRSLSANVEIDYVDGSGSIFVPKNTDDDDINEVCDKDQNVGEVQEVNGSLPVDNELKKYKITTSRKNGTINLEVDTDHASHIRIWADETKTTLHAKQWEVTDSKIQEGEGGTAPTNESGKEGYFWVEGLINSDGQSDPVVIKAKISETDYDELKIFVVEVDLDVDSNNDEGTSMGYGGNIEEPIENSKKINSEGWPKRPGKFIVVNSGNTDGVPDWADGFNINPDDTEDNILSPNQSEFVEALIQKSDFFTSACEISFEYSSSNPADVQVTSESADWDPHHPYSYTLPAGNNKGQFRIWKKSAGNSRDKESIGAGGDYIPSDSALWIKWSDLPRFESDNILKIYCEAVIGSKSLGDSEIKVKIRENYTDEDGNVHQITAEDIVTITAIEVETEPITTKMLNVSGDRLQYNPSVPSATTSPYVINIKPSDYPDQKIKWTAQGGWEISSQSGKFGFIKASSDGGSATATVEIDGVYTPQPQFKGYGLGTKNINVTFVNLMNVAGTLSALPRADAETLTTSIISRLNETWLNQGRLHFSKDGQVNELANDNFFDNQLGISVSITDAATHRTTGLLDEYTVSNDEIKIIFCRSNLLTLNVLGANFDRAQWGEGGIIVKCASKQLNQMTGEVTYTPYTIERIANVLCHEVGHAFYLKDIYINKQGTESSNPDLPFPVGSITRPSWLLGDWNGSYWLSPRYYPANTTQVSLINKILMNGFSNPSEDSTYDITRDIPAGDVYGYKVTGYDKSGNKIYGLGDVDVGMDTLIEHDRKSNH